MISFWKSVCHLTIECIHLGRSLHALELSSLVVVSGGFILTRELLNYQLGGSVTVTRQILDLFIGVRIPASQPIFSFFFICNSLQVLCGLGTRYFSEAVGPVWISKQSLLNRWQFLDRSVENPPAFIPLGGPQDHRHSLRSRLGTLLKNPLSGWTEIPAILRERTFYIRELLSVGTSTHFSLRRTVVRNAG